MQMVKVIISNTCLLWWKVFFFNPNHIFLNQHENKIQIFVLIWQPMLQQETLKNLILLEHNGLILS